ncbi:MAG: YhgE/Pip domain-containing protein, partial [[Ruminococcus] torques]|uniref:YhgE/Pip family protein n=1 Tax=[Ruminococcus] torques TaxID=33039 RepID=UPI00241DEE66
MKQLLFWLIGLFQSGLICLGDLYFLEIQCEHPFYFLLAGWFTSIVFVNMIYTLTVSFGDIGKAICVVLLVIQVAGSGGTFPIEMTPMFFQKLYVLLPFTHSMNAMRECIAGFYSTVYWKELGTLALFLIPALLLGLLLRKPVIRLNDAFTEKLESTKLI